jgi:hypothetical protein
MTETHQTPPYTLQMDDKVAHVMVYTWNSIYWGEVVVKELIRVSTWLRTNTAPDRITLYNVKVMNTISSSSSRPVQFTELHISTSQVLGFHLIPPAKDPLDYDSTEPNRRMQPVTLLFSTFRVDGNIRLATRTTLAKYLEVAVENYSAIYDAQVSNLLNPGFGVISVPFLLVRQESAVFAIP